MRKFLAIIFVSLMLTVFSLSTANAVNLITNGGFESGDLSGWSCTGADYAYASTTPYEGTWAFQGYDNSGYATLSQSIATTIGSTYDFSFFSKAYQVAGNELGYSFSGYGDAVFVTTTTDWAQTIDSFVAAASTTSVELYFATDSGTGTWLIDNVSVELGSAAVPEPVTMILFGLGLIGLAGARRKFRK